MLTIAISDRIQTSAAAVPPLFNSEADRWLLICSLIKLLSSATWCHIWLFIHAFFHLSPITLCYFSRFRISPFFKSTPVTHTRFQIYASFQRRAEDLHLLKHSRIHTIHLDEELKVIMLILWSFIPKVNMQHSVAVFPIILSSSARLIDI